MTIFAIAIRWNDRDEHDISTKLNFDKKTGNNLQFTKTTQRQRQRTKTKRNEHNENGP